MRAVVLVHYRTPDLLERSLEQVASTWSRQPGDRILVVDNSADRETVSRSPASGRLCAGNLGYAGAINLARRHLEVDSWVVMNPDVLPQDDCLDRVFAALASGVDVCGPSFFWDEARTVHLPPADPQGRLGLVLESLAAHRWPLLHRLIRRRYRRHARRHWTATEPLPSRALSGALLGLSERAFRRAGAWDEGYRLYFEETDWLLRCAKKGLRLEYHPRAQAVHLYDQSPAEPGTTKASRFAASQRRYLERYHPSLTRLRDFVGRQKTPATQPAVAQPPPRAGEPDRESSAEAHEWVEWSPNPHGYPMAASRTSVSGLPEEIRARHPQMALWARGVTARGTEFAL